MFKRIKYDYKFRLYCVEAVLKKRLSKTEVCKNEGIRKSNLTLWIAFYNAYGKNGLKARQARSYDTQFKLNVIKTINQENLSLDETCVKFNIPSYATIINWQKAFKIDGVHGLVSKKRGRPPTMKEPIKRKTKKASKPLTREEELLKELAYLRAENALLKKLQALVQADKKQKP
jgi:transposase